MKIDKERSRRSVEWLFENYRHITEAPEFSPEEKAGYLAACCHPTRCYLMTLSLRQRIDEIYYALTQGCDECGAIGPRVQKGDHHGGIKTVCEDRDACHRRQEEINQP